MIWKITTTSRQGRHRHNQIQMSQRSHATQQLGKFLSLPSPSLSPSPRHSFVHISHTKAKKGLIGISRRVSKSLFCFAVFLGPQHLKGDRPGWLAAWQVFSVLLFFSLFFGLIASTSTRCQVRPAQPRQNALSTALWVFIWAALRLFSSRISHRDVCLSAEIHLYSKIPFWWTRRFSCLSAIFW